MGIKKIEEVFKKLRDNNKKAFIPYLMAGDGGIEFTEKNIYILEGLGASIIEVGVPFSDPVADGTVIQAAGQRALQQGINMDIIFSLTERIRKNAEIPIVLMTYFNPIMQYGINRFYNMCRDKGVDGIIIPDMPLEEWNLISEAANTNGIASIPLVAPTSGAKRIELANKLGNGYIYTVTVAGVTGARKDIGSNLDELLKEVKEISTIPVVAGFGISDHAQVEEIGSYCDGVVVGSKIVELFHNRDYEGVKRLICG